MNIIFFNDSKFFFHKKKIPINKHFISKFGIDSMCNNFTYFFANKECKHTSKDYTLLLKMTQIFF